MFGGAEKENATMENAGKDEDEGKEEAADDSSKIEENAKDGTEAKLKETIPENKDDKVKDKTEDERGEPLKNGTEEKEDEPKGGDDKKVKKDKKEKNKDKKPAEDASKEEKKEKKNKDIKVPLVLESAAVDIVDLPETDIDIARARLLEFRELEAAKKENEGAKNMLESFVYKVQDRLYDDEVAKVSTEEERENLRTQLSETSDWLYDEGDALTAAEYIARGQAINVTAKEIFYRLSEMQERPAAIDKLQKSLNMSYVLLPQRYCFSGVLAGQLISLCY